ncbi:MAG: nucleotide exchange factor GrpE [Saprospiraceae bacterium]|nr:nucleotide exchange factor GrpE [Saprospiraceae bacterium]
MNEYPDQNPDELEIPPPHGEEEQEVAKDLEQVVISDDLEPTMRGKDIPLEINTGIGDDEILLTKEDFQVLTAHFAAVEQQLEQLGTEFQSKLKYDAHKEKIIDNLHAELQTYKNGLIEKLLRPIFMDIIEVVDDTRRLLKDLKAKGEDTNPEKLKKLLESIPDDLEDLLDKHGVEVVQAESEAFNPAVQKVVKTVPTPEESLDKQVSERLKNGYRWEGRLLRHEVVNVWQFQKPS